MRVNHHLAVVDVARREVPIIRVVLLPSLPSGMNLSVVMRSRIRT